eukprot:CAMPEP_0170589702 /NCGR_PEP_ID=MMETSP0224-20130122/11484_1 /TAXON_ID=285029 /ORGANISM="Togula jolla, Strain CCCM 725" /LENGTH=383 /DNA_ID=CAMNT_0010913463 /DNA_START=52 /DNA_END=1203 /DNA_ORIENTATION=+
MAGSQSIPVFRKRSGLASLLLAVIGTRSLLLQVPQLGFTTVARTAPVSPLASKTFTADRGQTKIPRAIFSKGTINVASGERYSSKDWFYNLINLPKSNVLKRIFSHVLACTLLAALVVYLRIHGKCGVLPATLHGLLGGFISLLLVFRTNAAYGRFWEARIIWGAVMNSSRKLSTSVVANIFPLSPAVGRRLLTLFAAFPLALAHRNNGQPLEELSETVVKLLPAPRSSCPPIGICMEMERAITDAAVESESVDNALKRQVLLQNVNELIDATGALDRIIKTPVPLSYSRHTSRALSIWCGTLPFALVDIMGWGTVPFVAVACWCLFGIEEIGHMIEQPFLTKKHKIRGKPFDFSLPADGMANVIRTEIKTIAGEARFKVVDH